MFGKIMLTAVTAMVLSACADPTYATSQTPTTENKEQNGATCDAIFSTGHCVALVWEKMPTDGDFGSFIFKTFQINAADGSQNLVDLNGTMAVVLWMPSMGHGSSPVKVEKLETGTFRAKNVFFTMGGSWEIRIQLKDGNEITDEAIIPINL